MGLQNEKVNEYTRIDSGNTYLLPTDVLQIWSD